MPVTLTLPKVVADELVAAGVCNRPLLVRGGAELVAIGVTVVGVAGNFSSVVVAVPMFRDFARQLVNGVAERRPDDAPASATIDLETRGVDGTSVRISVSAADAEAATEAIVRTLEAVSRSS